MTEIVDSSERDYFTDHSVLHDPNSFFDEMRGKSPVYQLKNRDILLVTGFAETVQVFNNPKDFSSAIAPGSPVPPLPFEPEGDDLTAQIEAHRSQFIAGEILVAQDDIAHTYARTLLNRLFVPSRLKANEEYVAQLADQMVREAVANRSFETVKEIGVPFVTLVIADLLGVPDEDRDKFRNVLDQGPPPGSMDLNDVTIDVGPLEYMAGFFGRYLTERRAQSRGDVLSDLASATYPDGRTPEIGELVQLAATLFGAGQDTSAKMIGNVMLILAERPDLQQQLRADRSLIAPFLEEALRLEGSTKITSRLARRNTSIGDVEVPAGKKILLGLFAANCDPRRWEDPYEFKLNRPRIKEHLAFGRGPHVCVGAPLARIELSILIDRFLEYTSKIELDEADHGPSGDRRLSYEPSFIIRGLKNLHLKLTPSETVVDRAKSTAAQP